MISLKCKNCAGEMAIDLKGELVCPYCGSKAHLSDDEFKDYKAFRLNMLHYLRAAADNASDQADGAFLWDYHDNVMLKSSDGSEISIDYLFYSEDDGIKSYVARKSVVYIFPASKKDKADSMLEALKMLQYPPADVKNLSRYFPTINSMIELDDGGILIAAAKPENAYPLYAFGNLRPEHAAWIVSRLENICCVLEFSGINHNGITINSVFINTKTHEAFLYGGWWHWKKKNGIGYKHDLCSIRDVAGRIMGAYKEQAPKLFLDFIKGWPEIDAYTDFEKWDEVIEKGFGGHKFKKF